ncbi:MAG: hypothetical protein ABSH51_09530 [Solirubrobacteraceae bacterium]|jgi:hypothetical protein
MTTRPPWRPKITAGTGAVKGALLLSAVLAILFAQTSTGRTVLDGLGVSGSPRGFVELYFAAPRSVPAHVVSGTRRVVTFVVHSEEPRVEVVGWSIASTGSAARITGAVRLAPGRSVIVRQPVDVVCREPRMYVEVALPGRATEIGYWSDCTDRRPLHRASKRSHGARVGSRARRRQRDALKGRR